MYEYKPYLWSGIFSLICSAILLWLFSYADKSSEIIILQESANKPVYLKTQEQMNKEMAVIMLPLLQKQKKQNEERSRIKKPDMVYAPEQLQHTKGY